MVELQSFLRNHAVDFAHMGRADHSQDQNSGNGDGCGNGKRPLNSGGANGNDNGGKKPRPDEHEDVSKDKSKYKGQVTGKGKLRNGRRINFNAIMKALTPKEPQHYHEKQLCFQCHKPGHRPFKCPML
jgi:hypothetical protein